MIADPVTAHDLPVSQPAPPRTPAFRLFEVTGIELEYPIVGPHLEVRHLVEDAFRHIAGRPTSDTEHGGAGFSNELADHVFELKTLVPERSLVAAEAALAEGVRYFNRVLADGWGARLLPTGMHPFMQPDEGRLWRRSGRAIYATYDRVFGIGGHGWMNVQACHLNFPFGRSEAETVRLHEAIRGLLPYLPALAASSPVVEGRLGPAVDNRLTFYGRNQARVPRISGDVIPEAMTTLAAYRRDVLGAIYRDLAAIPEAARLRHEWVNSRGAIVRFMRDAIEIRVLDTQECPRMDVALAAFVRGVLAGLVRRLEAGDLELPPQAELVADYRRCVAEGSAARVVAPHLRPQRDAAEPVPAAEVLAGLLEVARDELEALRPVHGGDDETPYLDLVARRLAGGNLSERLRARLAGVSAEHLEGTLRDLYGELADCLDANRPWFG